MSVIYENKSEITLEKYLYQCNNPIGKKTKKQLKIWKTTQISAMVVTLMLSIMCFKSNSAPLGVVAAMFFLIFVYNVFFKRNMQNKKLQKQIIDNQPDGKWYRTITFDKNIKVTDGNTVTTFEYANFARYAENERYYLLFKDANAVLRIEKGAFVKGDEATFPRFIQNKIKKNTKA